MRQINSIGWMMQVVFGGRGCNSIECVVFIAGFMNQIILILDFFLHLLSMHLMVFTFIKMFEYEISSIYYKKSQTLLI